MRFFLYYYVIKKTVDLTFKVEYKNSINRKFLVASSKYFAPFAWVNKRIKIEAVLLEVNDYFAMAEKISAKL